MSIPLNIAEESGKTSGKDRSRFHAIVRRSEMECGAILDILRFQHLLAQTDPEAMRAKPLLVRIVSMLSKMSR